MLYIYRCASCGHEEEVHHSIKEDPALPCPRCTEGREGSCLAMRRVIQPVGFRTPGPGFHDTGRA